MKTKSEAVAESIIKSFKSLAKKYQTSESEMTLHMFIISGLTLAVQGVNILKEAYECRTLADAINQVAQNNPAFKQKISASIRRANKKSKGKGSQSASSHTNPPAS